MTWPPPNALMIDVVAHHGVRSCQVLEFLVPHMYVRYIPDYANTEKMRILAFLRPWRRSRPEFVI